MDPSTYPIIAAIIGILGPILGAIISNIYTSKKLKQEFELKKKIGLLSSQAENSFPVYKNIPGNGILGKWIIRINQVVGPDKKPIQFDIEWYLEVTEDKVYGTASFVWKEKPIKLSLLGRYIDRGYFQIDYKDVKPEVLRYGTFFLQLSSNSEKLEGRFLGYAPEVENVLIFGTAEGIKSLE